MDPVGDPSESIQLMPHSASVEVQQEIADRFSSGTLVEARIFVAMHARREIILTFLIALAEIFEAAVFPSETEPRQHEQERKASNKCGITCQEELGARSALLVPEKNLKRAWRPFRMPLGRASASAPPSKSRRPKGGRSGVNCAEPANDAAVTNT